MAAGPDFRAGAGPRCANGTQILLLIDPALTLLTVAGRAIGFRNSIAFFRWAPHANNGFVLVRGVRAPIVGAISMDGLAVDVGGIDGVTYGDEFVLIGAQGDARITADPGAKPWTRPAVSTRTTRESEVAHCMASGGMGPHCQKPFASRRRRVTENWNSSPTPRRL